MNNPVTLGCVDVSSTIGISNEYSSGSIFYDSAAPVLGRGYLEKTSPIPVDEFLLVFRQLVAALEDSNEQVKYLAPEEYDDEEHEESFNDSCEENDKLLERAQGILQRLEGTETKTEA